MGILGYSQRVAEYRTFIIYILRYWDSSEQWSTSVEVCACSCSGVWFSICEFEFCSAFDENPLKMFEFCPAFDKKFALDESQFSHYWQVQKCCIWHWHLSICVEYILGISKLLDNARTAWNIVDEYSIFGYSPRIPNNTHTFGAGFTFAVTSLLYV